MMFKKTTLTLNFIYYIKNRTSIGIMYLAGKEISTSNLFMFSTIFEYTSLKIVQLECPNPIYCWRIQIILKTSKYNWE